MESPNVLLLYASSYGQTAKIARRMAERLQRRGIDVELVDAALAEHDRRPPSYSAVLVGSSLIVRGVQPAVRRYVRRHVDALNDALSAFYLVSASAGSVDRKGREEAVAAMDKYLAGAGWSPSLTASIAGAVNYTRYGFFLRWFMRRASAAHGGATDTTRDHEYTNWEQVDVFADEFADAVFSRRRKEAERLRYAATAK